MSEEFVDAKKIKESLNWLDSFLDSYAKIISQAKTGYEPCISGIVESVAHMSRQFNDSYKDMKLSNEAVKYIIASRKWLDELQVSLTALSEIQTFNDAIKCEETLDQLIDVAPLEEEQKIELRFEVAKNTNSGDYWDRKNYYLSVIALIFSLIFNMIQLAMSYNESDITINIKSPTFIFEDIEEAENAVDQLSELLDKLQEE